MVDPIEKWEDSKESFAYKEKTMATVAENAVMSITDTAVGPRENSIDAKESIADVNLYEEKIGEGIILDEEGVMNGQVDNIETEIEQVINLNYVDKWKCLFFFCLQFFFHFHCVF